MPKATHKTKLNKTEALKVGD